MNWFIDVLKNKYAKFDGRASRSEYWFFHLFHIIAVIVLAVLIQIPYVRLVAELLLMVYCLGIIVPIIAVTTRRLHDVGRSGWLQLLYLVPIVGIVIFVFTVLPGTSGDNRFGPPAPTSPGT